MRRAAHCDFRRRLVSLAKSLVAAGVVLGSLAADTRAAAPQSTSPPSRRADTATFTGLPVRSWLDRSGNRHAQARLTGLDGDMAHFKTADGRSVRTQLDRLSPDDQTYVRQAALNANSEPDRPATTPSSANTTGVPATADSSSTAAGNVVHEFVESQFAGSQLLKWLGASGVEHLVGIWAGASNEPLPENVVYARVSRKVMNRFVARPIKKTGPVVDTVLGAAVGGRSVTTGHTELVLLPNKDHAVGEIGLTTDVSLDTIATQSPVHIFSRGHTRVRAGRPITFDGRDLVVGKVWAKAHCESVTTGITSDLWLLNGPAVRIAARRVAEDKAQVDAITAAHAEAKVRAQFARDSARELAVLQKAMADQTAALSRDPALGDFGIRCATEPEALTVVLLRGPSTMTPPRPMTPTPPRHPL